MTDHPKARLLASLLKRELSRAEQERLWEHVEGCDRCARAAFRVAALLLPSPPVPMPRAERDAMYDAVIDRVKAAQQDAATGQKVRRMARERERAARVLAAVREARDESELLQAAGKLPGTWAYCDLLAECSRELRHREPQRMIWFAELAQRAAEHLNADRYGRGPVLDRQALALAELGNAYRAADRLAEAEQALTAALARWTRGTGDPLLKGRILDMTASLRGAQRRFAAAVALLDDAFEIFELLADPHLAGRALIKKGLILTYRQDAEAAVGLVRRGLAMIDRQREPKLALAALHQSLVALVDCGQFQRAREDLFAHRGLYLQDGDALSLLKMRWVEGEIFAGLGKLGRAEALLREVREGLADAQLNYHAAIAGLELGAVLLRQGRSAEVHALVSEIAAVFRALGIAREALGAVILLRQACEQETLTLDALNETLRTLKQLDRDLGGRTEPQA